MDRSKAEVGSSRIMNEGFKIRDLAIATRCLCPPENSWGYLNLSSGLISTAFKQSAIRSSFCFLFRLKCTSKPSPTISPTVIRGEREP